MCLVRQRCIHGHRWPCAISIAPPAPLSRPLDGGGRTAFTACRSAWAFLAPTPEWSSGRWRRRRNSVCAAPLRRAWLRTCVSLRSHRPRSHHTHRAAPAPTARERHVRAQLLPPMGSPVAASWWPRARLEQATHHRRMVGKRELKERISVEASDMLTPRRAARTGTPMP
jgi:hypothetical protein